MAAVAPLAILLGILATLAVVLTSYRAPVSAWAATYGNRFRYDLDLAGMHVEPQQYGLVMIGIGAVLWTLLMVIFRPNLLVALLLFILTALLTVYVARRYLRMRRSSSTTRTRGMTTGTALCGSPPGAGGRAERRSGTPIWLAVL